MEEFTYKPIKQLRQAKLFEFRNLQHLKTYWRLYNQSQTQEKTLFFRLLEELCDFVDEKHNKQKGMITRSSSYKIFCMCLKVYLGMSSRRIISDLEHCKRMNYITKVPHFNTLLNYFNDSDITRYLIYLIELSALPLVQLESTFAVDSTGISSHKYAKWSMVREVHKKHRLYRKLHCICGVYSNIITTAIITDGNKGDSPRFKELLERTAKNFSVEVICADKAYSSRDNLKLAVSLGISPFIPFKKNTTAKARGSMLWTTIFNYFKNNKEEFMHQYHLRSNIESSFHMIKSKFGEFVRSKNKVSQDNEILCKILCHNLCVLIQEMFISKININFRTCATRCFAQP